MHIVSVRTLERFWGIHPDAEGPLTDWYEKVEAARWETPADALASISHVSVLGDRWLVFNIGGGKYRLVAKIGYRTKVVFVRFVGTHAEYDKIDANEV